jgi:hypothetical protein
MPIRHPRSTTPDPCRLLERLDRTALGACLDAIFSSAASSGRNDDELI